MVIRPDKIVSGGQTGVDRAALDVAIELGITHSGWCPSGRKAEDGVIPARYQLHETETSEYIERTRLNVRDSDGTLVLGIGEPTGGTLQTIRIADELNKPLLSIDLSKPPTAAQINHWLQSNNIKVLNIAGPRGSKQPDIGKLSRDFLKKLFT